MRTTIKRSSTLLEFLIEQYPDSPRTRIKKLLQSGDVRVNNNQATLHSFQLKEGDTVEISRSGMKASRAGLPFKSLYEDQYLIAIDKPAGISTSNIDGSRNVQDILSGFLKSISKNKVRSYVVHRLDKEVSGVVLFSKSKEAMESLRENWDATEKHYFALVEGAPPENEGTVKSWLTEDKHQKVHSTFERENARLAITDYKVIKQIDKYTLLNVTTRTGRKNQIRVHLSDIGCPIVGDRKYGASDEFVRRVRLHACSLTFPHPVTGKKIAIESPVPENFLVVKEGDEKYK